MATQPGTRADYDIARVVIARICMILAALILLLFAFGVLTNGDRVSWGWVGIGLVVASWAIG